MFNDQFQESLDYQLQNMALTDKEEMREIARHRRGIERDIHKSYLRKEENEYKQRLKGKSEEIAVYNNSIIHITYNGVGKIERQDILFACRVEEVRVYQRTGSKEKLWQVCIIEYGSNLEVVSLLYDEKHLFSLGKLRLTILSRYVTNDSKRQAAAWKWIQKYLIYMLESVGVEEIPAAPGWHGNSIKSHFWTAEDKDTLLTNDFIEQFSIKRFDTITGREAAEDLYNVNIREFSKIGDTNAGVLLIYHLYALVGRLVENNSICPGITLMGESAEAVAGGFLRTMQNEVDTMNLDADRIEMIGKKVKSLQDTPAIFLVSNPDSRSSMNRVEKIMSWMMSGCIEGKRISIPFIFCMKNFSAYFPLKNTVVIDVSGFKWMEKECPYKKLQSYVISVIERSGDYWVDKMRNRYKKLYSENDSEIVSMIKTITSIILEMFKEEADSLHYWHLKEMMDMGEAEICRQLSSTTGPLVELFLESVRTLVDSGEIVVVERDKAPVSCTASIIYYDSQCYYFTKDTMNAIGEQIEIDARTMLSIKQQLVEQEGLKIYKKTMKGYRDLEVDFRICNAYGQRKDLSGVAIWCELFDNVGGTKLYERSREP